MRKDTSGTTPEANSAPDITRGTQRPATAEWVYAEYGPMEELLGRILCWIGFHDFHVIDASFSFGEGGEVETVECRRCGFQRTRHGGE